jgi:cyanate permease
MPLTGNSWRLTLLCFAGVALLAAVAWLLFARDPVGHGGQGASAPTSVSASFRQLLNLPVIRLVLVIATGTFVFGHSFNNWLPEILRSQGMSPTDAGMWAAFPTTIAMVSAFFIPRLTSDRWLTPVQVVVFLASAAAALLIAFTTGPLQYLGLVLLGVGRGCSSSLLLLTLLRSPQVGPGLMGAAGGLFFTAGELGGVIGPTMTGLLADATGAFDTGMTVLAGVSVVTAFLSLALGVASQAVPRSKEEADVEPLGARV